MAQSSEPTLLAAFLDLLGASHIIVHSFLLEALLLWFLGLCAHSHSSPPAFLASLQSAQGHTQVFLIT
jgi:hypothetical protein